MTRIVVFDSGLGSLSIIKAIQKQTKCEIIYFADEKSYPYGTKSVRTLRKIILNSIKSLNKVFNPDLIVIASNTPTLLLQDIFKKNKKIIGVLPPIEQAKIISKKTICVLATKSVVSNKSFQKYLKHHSAKDKKIICINASPLVDLVESGKIFTNKKHCINKINKILSKEFIQYNVDTVTLSSTHLPFLLPFLKKQFPNISFIDPADLIATTISKKILKKKSVRNKLHIYTSGNTLTFEKKLLKLNIRHKVKQFLI